MRSQDDLIIAQSDYQKLTALLHATNNEGVDLLEEELSRASIVADDQLPKDVVSMNSTVKFTDIDTGHETVITLVFPHDADIEQSKISVLAPVGSALIGLRVGQKIEWPIPNGKAKNLKVVSVSV